MVQEETAYPLPLGWGSGPLIVLPGSPLGLVPGTWRALSEHLLNERRGGRVSSVPLSASFSHLRRHSGLNRLDSSSLHARGILGASGLYPVGQKHK